MNDLQRYFKQNYSTLAKNVNSKLWDTFRTAIDDHLKMAEKRDRRSLEDFRGCSKFPDNNVSCGIGKGIHPIETKTSITWIM